MLSAAGVAGAATFDLTLYGVPYPNPDIQSNISKYTNIFTGTFEIADSALKIPNNLVLFRNPDFLNFDVSFTTKVRTYDFNLHDPLTEVCLATLLAAIRKESDLIRPGRHKDSIRLRPTLGAARVLSTIISERRARSPK